MEKDTRPNILLITADQLRYDYVGAYEKEPFVQTPNIDALAEEGRLYENAYSPNPVCIPARHNLITGLTDKYHGFDDNYFGKDAKSCPYDLPTFAEILSDAGYKTAAIGKMHFQPERRATGFDLFLNADEVVPDITMDEYAMFLHDNGYANVGSYHGVRNVLYMQPQRSLVDEEHHGSYWIAEKSIEFIQNHKTNPKPFLLWTGFKHPHPPLDIPDNWAHVNDGKIPHHTSSITPLSKLAEENKCIADLPNEESINRMREAYANAISFVDYNVGRIVDALKETGMYENTLIIMTADHGEMLGDLDTYQKFLPYDPSSRIPMIFHWPNVIKQKEICTDFVDLNDLLPTFVDLANTKYPGVHELPGESLFAKEPKKNRSYQYIEHQRNNKRWCAVLNHEYKYVHFYGDKDQLFDMKNDPYEQIDLLYDDNDHKYDTIVDEMRKVLISYEEKWGLPGYIINGKFKEFPEYEIQSYRETCFPNQVIRLPGDHVDALEKEILQAIKEEPTVKLSKLHIKELLVQYDNFTEERWEELIEEAKKINRY